jgi:ribosomal protein S18 acetylase RimI-like enzyme
MTRPTIRVEGVQDRHLADLLHLLHAIRREDTPEDPPLPDAAADGFNRSLSQFPIQRSDSAWALIAYLSDPPAGLAVLTRIPKLDARLGFLYLDELHVLAPFRRHGAGRALLRETVQRAQSFGLAGVRLLARPENEPAQELYRSPGFHGSETLLYERRFDPFVSHV